MLVGRNSGNNHRSSWDLLRSCLSTLVLCTWSVVHPDIQAPQKKKGVISNRMLLFIIGVMAPEYLTGYAVAQFLAARRSMARFKAEGRGDEWSLVHGFYVEMGGFVARRKRSRIRKS